jgi:hypothetical protein
LADEEAMDDVAIVPKVMMDLLRHNTHVVHDTLLLRKQRLKIANAKIDLLTTVRKQEETPVDAHNHHHVEMLRRLWSACVGCRLLSTNTLFLCFLWL